MEVVGCGALAKIVRPPTSPRFKSKDAYARHNGTAPLPVWSSNETGHRLSRTGNRQLNAALHRMGMTKARWYLPAQTMVERRKAGGDSGLEALRILKRRLSDVVCSVTRRRPRQRPSPPPLTGELVRRVASIFTVWCGRMGCARGAVGIAGW